jgi:hypothetical protein
MWEKNNRVVSIVMKNTVALWHSLAITKYYLAKVFEQI